MLLQDNCPVAYASRSLTEAASRYAQGTLGSSVQPGAIQPIHVWKESARRISAQTPGDICEEALSDTSKSTTAH